LTNLHSILSKFQIHPLFWCVIGIAVITGRFREIVMVFLIVFVHEMGHAVAAHFFRWRIKKIQLLPFGGVAEFDEHGNRPIKEEMIVILAGPIQHIWMLAVAYICYSGGILAESDYRLFLFHNIVILAFNLLPVWPLDGGKLLFSFISIFHPFSQSHKIALTISLMVVLLISAYSVVVYTTHLNLWIILIFIVVSHYTEWKHRSYVKMRFLLERYYGRKDDRIQKLRPLHVEKDEMVLDVLSKFYRGCKHQITISYHQNRQMQIDENELLHAYFKEKKTTYQIGELFQ
jgi:stage IV sporulation protein FB